MKEVKSYRDLKVWNRAMDLVEECYRLTSKFPKTEIYGLSSQIQRAAVSIPANIAEGKGRQHLGDYIRHLCIANGSLKELETHLLLSKRVNLASNEAIAPVLHQCESVGRLLTALIRALENKN